MAHKYIDLHVHSSHSTGTESIARMAEYAEKLDLSAICILDHVETREQLQTIRAEAEAIKSKVQILVGAEIRSENVEELRSKIRLLRKDADIIAVYGGSLKINRAAVEDSMVDILLHPELKRKDAGLDDVMMKLAADNGVAVELNFREFLHSYRKLRAHILSHMESNVELAKKFGTKIIVSSGAENVWELRAGRELSSLGYLCGLSISEAIESVSAVPEEILEHVRKVKSKNFVMPGVEVVSDG